MRPFGREFNGEFALAGPLARESEIIGWTERAFHDCICSEPSMKTALSGSLRPAVFFSLALIVGVSLTPASAQQPGRDANPNAAITNRNSPASRARTNDPIARIRDEGLNHSQVMQTLSYLSDVIGPRLTGSPNMKRANEWTREKLASWGLANSHLEAWGPFGRGWSLKKFSAQVIEPQAIPLIAAPKAWTPGFDKPISADVVHIDAKSESDLEKYKGKLKGAIVLASPVREVRARFDAFASRFSESNLLRLANAGPTDNARNFSPGRGAGTNSPSGTNTARSGGFFGRAAGAGPDGTEGQPASTNATRGSAAPGQRGGGAGSLSGRILDRKSVV